MNRLFVLKQGCAAHWVLNCFSIFLGSNCFHAQAEDFAVTIGPDGRLAYQRDELGNHIPDFSHCGYAGGDRGVPDVEARITINPADGDDGKRIQNAIDHVASLPLDESGFRGAILFGPGRFEIRGQLRISASGIVLRGAGAGTGGTTLVATGTGRRTLIRIEGVGDRRVRDSTQYRVVDDYVPVGSNKLRLDSTSNLRVGERLIIARPSTNAWFDAIGMDTVGVAWKAATRDIRWDRVIVGIDDETVTVDAPITTAIEKRFGGATLEPFDWPGLVANVGIEDLQVQSEFERGNPHDEEHAWFGITIQNVENAWVRRVEFRYLAGGAVALWENCKWITVSDCIAIEPVSEIGGYRRQSYFTEGQLTLFLRCWSNHGRHDFAVGHCAPGPNAFVNCYAAETFAGSGPIESWASGVLYDNVRIDGGSLDLINRWVTAPGTGWSAANCVLWQCQASSIQVFRPPGANNWALGVWGATAGDGTIQGRSDFIEPLSLYQAQLRDRRGDEAAADAGLGLIEPVGATNPTLSQAAEFAAQSAESRNRLIDVIRKTMTKAAGRADARSARLLAPTVLEVERPVSEQRPLNVKNGWLVIDGKLVAGDLIQQPFWRGTIRPDESPALGPAITRFVPGRTGTGFTDDLVQVTSQMLAKDVAVFDHHYGLWYDRRRDDHTMVRQQDGSVAPPFYEQPFARTGTGKAWDGLSKYDLTKFNPWYWGRLREFARLCDQRGLVLFHQNYFQHNLLEAGAHWVDCPWRPANNVNDTGLPEPPLLVGDKRIFMASQFYDVTNPRLRKLHRGYIRQCLDNFAGCSNVIQFTSAEYSGPLEFTQFWLDTIIEWQREHSHDVLIALSAPKDVQDAILADPEREPYVDMIDIRYWAYTAGGGLYAPQGGKNLAPRQHLRQTKEKPGGFAAIAKAVREYRSHFPEKAITYYADMHCPSGRDGWAVLIGGGSLANVSLPAKLGRIVPTMVPVENFVTSDDTWCLANQQGDALIYVDQPGITLQINATNGDGRRRLHWIDIKTNKVSTEEVTTTGDPFRVMAKTNLVWLEAPETK
jgi:uncharacterized protein DUF6298